MNIKISKNIVLFALTCGLGIFLAIKTYPTKITPSIKAIIYQQKNNIQTLNSPKDITNSKIFYMDSINFPQGNTLKHPKIGELGYTTNFFIDFKAMITTLKSASYDFLIYSDDGFRLLIDNKPVCEFIKDRPFLKNKCTIHLKKGEHTLDISYFQGYGNLGIKAYYRISSSRKYKFIGENSKFIKFKEMR